MNDFRSDFPFFQHHPNIVYLDSASTTQKPQQVLDCITQYYAEENANIGRSTYQLSSQLSHRVEQVRQQVAAFIGATSVEEVFFTSGATESLRIPAVQWGLEHMREGDEILYSPVDHSAAVQPWFDLQKQLHRFGVNIHCIEYGIRKTGGIDVDDLVRKLTPKTRVVVLTHIHNIFGTDSDINEITKAVRLYNSDIIIILDAAQSISHIPVDVQQLDIDILAFSGHKLFAAQGVGVMYIHTRIQEMMSTITYPVSHSDRHGIEQGTLDIPGILSLGVAIEYVQSIGFEQIQQHISKLTEYCLNQLQHIPNIEFLPGPYYWSCDGGHGILSFRHSLIPSQDIGFILNEYGICVRTGSHCSFSGDVDQSIRVSMHLYNTKKDIDVLAQVLEKELK